ncbi:LANO_0G12794g1_1 [Lachancea nothofagi CBS 11611]|uniref:LANO_0G12794g1_1 n=1 Tax=Lachancea nothofagi CBS 11611 TaxID=1266666 RepID=A0A1G4KK28_9SACH|nr:LANO_0G12794g1_1 [Lachancea nothofagi CBS 11611]
MSLEASRAEVRELAAKFVPQINQVYACSNLNIDESKLLGELLKLIDKIPEDEHLFCDEAFRSVSVFCLTLFSFSNQGTVTWLKGRFDPVLARCKDCVLHFTRGRCKMLQHFSVQRKVPHEHVTKFNNIVSHWRSQALLPVIQGISVNNNTGINLSKNIEVALYECFCNPQVLRTNEILKGAFDAIFKFLYNSNHSILSHEAEVSAGQHVHAGLIFCWFEGNHEEVQWARDCLEKLNTNHFTFSEENFTQDILEEINVHLLYLQNSSNFHEALVSHFWSKFTPIYYLLSPSLIGDYLIVPPNLESLRMSIRYPIESIYKLWYRHFAHTFREKPLGVLLKALRVFLEKIGIDFWGLIEPFTFHSILDLVFDKNVFSNTLIKVQDIPLTSQGYEALLSDGVSLTDLVSWTLPFYHSLSPPKRIQMVKKVSIAFLRVISSHQMLKPIPKACLINSSTALLSAVLAVTDKERSMLYSSESFETTLFTKLDSRALLNNDMVLNLVLQAATNPDMFFGAGQSIRSVSYSAMKVLANCIDYDILILCQASYGVYRGGKAHDVKVTTTLLSKVVQHLDLGRSQDTPRLAALLLASMRNVNGLLRPKTTDPSAAEHNRFIRLYVDLLKTLLAKITDILPSHLIKVLTDENGSKGFWSCIFTTDIEIYQTATNILYETFDVEGRLEGIQEMFSRSLDNSLESIDMVLSQLMKHEFFEPCPRAIRVLMDIIHVFSDPVNGTFANYKSMKNEKTDQMLKRFWRLSWEFLNMIYRATLKWASKYPYSELENFTKDTLDTSLSMIDAFREFSEALFSGNGKEQSDELLRNVLKTFQDMLYWLRLSDEYLLASCVKLVVKAADLAIERELKFDDDLVTTMARYALKARKFSNKLTPQQSSELLSRAKEFNENLIDKVTVETELYHKEKEKLKLNKETTPQSASSKDSSPPTVARSLPLESKVDFLQRKAMSSSLMGRPRSQSKITSFGTLKPGMTPSAQEQAKGQPTKLELARRQLLANRKVHPPSANVFNSRKPQQQRNNRDDSSDESEDDLEDAKELFSLSKAKERSTPIVLDINGKPIKKVDNAQRKKQEEENMRRRLNVDLNPFYRMVLRWNYISSGEYPSDSQDYVYEDVKDTFKSVEDYQRIMQPLLLLECWQGLCAARDREDNKPFSIVVGNRTVVSDFYEVYASVSKKMLIEANITESDLLVLAHFPTARNVNDVRADDFKNAENSCLAKVWGLKNSKGDNMDLTLRIDRSHQFSKFLTLRAEIFAVKVMQMTTVEREYTSLVGLPFYDLVNQITSGQLKAQHSTDVREIEQVKAHYKLNNSQAEAIVSTVSSEGFHLIQGPPGTGKTKTILGIIGYFLSTQKALPAGVIKQPIDSATAATSTEQLLLKQKVLICAPSNAAVDELVLRLKSGVFDKSGKLFCPKLVRLGRSDAVNAAIKDLTLEEQVDKKLGSKSYEFTSNPNLEQNLQSTIGERRQLRRKLDSEDGSALGELSTDDITKIQMSIRELSRKINELGKQKDEIRERNSVNYRNRELDRRRAQSRILAESDVICSTLSGSAHDILASLGVKFDTVIIDEACQCTELSTIIPLRYGAKRCIMVGDPNQLPPTVLSGAASKLKYNQSLFVRLEKKCSPHLLNVQYRMHPAISKFPSTEFYSGKLSDGPGMEASNSRPWHSRSPLGPYKFFDIATGRQEQNRKTMSFVNFEECKVAIELVENLLNNFENTYNFTGKIGVISPYREQMQTMKREFRKYFGNPIIAYVDFNTIDGFQGQEKEIIIISCVRADDTKSGVGFLKDFRRMNVALTRAKTSMWILGHHSSLFKNKLWRNLITDAKERNCLELACSGFLNVKNTKAATLLKNYAGSHDHIAGDDYDPTAPRANEKAKKAFKEFNKQKESRYSNVKAQPHVKSAGHTRETSGSLEASGRPSHHISDAEKKKKKEDIRPKSNAIQSLSGTKKKSSIFGGPSLVSGIEEKTGTSTINTGNTSALGKKAVKDTDNRNPDRQKSLKRVRFEDVPDIIGDKKAKPSDMKKYSKLENGPTIYESKREPSVVRPDSSDDSETKSGVVQLNKSTSQGDSGFESDSEHDGYDPSLSPSLTLQRRAPTIPNPSRDIHVSKEKTLHRTSLGSDPFIPKRKKPFHNKKIG